MKLAIVHYHLNKGGVTRIIEQIQCSLEDSGFDLLCLTGQPYKGDALNTTTYVPELDYQNASSSLTADILYLRVKEAVFKHWKGWPDVWHMHNHSLGKNPAWVEVVERLAREGHRMLLHVHDFAEDFRPSQYTLMKSLCPESLKKLYPIAGNVHYGVLNQRDYQILLSCGVPHNGLHILPNPVSFDLRAKPNPLLLEQFSCDSLWVYPTRSIRRKNMGEFVLAASVSQSDTHFAATLAPQNPQALGIYKQWVSFANKHNIRASFDVCGQGGCSFEEVMATAEALFTSSLAEGFGLAFLEPFILKKPLYGRDIPDITADFKQQDVCLTHLYKHLLVPIDYVDIDTLRASLGQKLRELYRSYGFTLPKDASETALQGISTNKEVDFAGLDEPLQRSIIEKTLYIDELKIDIRKQIFTGQYTGSVLKHNHRVVQKCFSLSSYAKRLAMVYRLLIEDGSPGTYSLLDPQKVLGAFLSPERFYLLRSL